jgi:hypothetical protein
MTEEATFPEALEAFTARVAPVRPVVLRGRTACTKCGNLFPVEIFCASSEHLDRSTILEVFGTRCSSCAAGEASSR